MPPLAQQTVDTVERLRDERKKYDFFTDIESDKAPKGLNEDIIRFISAKKQEPEWLLEWRIARLSALAQDERTRLGARYPSAH